MTASPTHLDAATEATHRLIRDALTASDLDPDTPSPEGSSELHLLPQVLPHLQLPPGLIPKLIADGADIEVTDRTGRTPLHYAAQYGRNADLVKALLAAGADPGARDENRQTPLHRAAAFSDNADVLEALLEAGAARNPRDDRNRTPLHLAAREGRSAAVTALLAAGAVIEARDEDGATPFHLAVARNDAAEVVAALRSAGGSWNNRDEWGRTPLDYCRSGQTFHEHWVCVRAQMEGADFLTFFYRWRWLTRTWAKVKRWALNGIFLYVGILLTFLLVSWPVSWLAYWLIEDPLWRHLVKTIVSLLGTVWIWLRGICWWATD